MAQLKRLVLLVEDVPRAGAFFNALGFSTRPFQGASSLLIDGVWPPLAVTRGPPQAGATATLCFSVPNLQALLPQLIHGCGAELEGGVVFEERGAAATLRHGGQLFTLVEEAAGELS